MKYLVRFQSGKLFDIFELDERSVEGVTGSMWWKMYPNYGEKYSRSACNPTSYKEDGDFYTEADSYQDLVEQHIDIFL